MNLGPRTYVAYVCLYLSRSTSFNPLNSFKISESSKKHAEEKELLYIPLFFGSFMHHLFFWRCFNGAFGAAFRQGLDDAKTALKTAMWKTSQPFKTFNCKKYLTYQVRKYRIAGDLPHCTLFTEQVQNQLIWTWQNHKTGQMLKQDAQMEPQSSGCSLHFLWLWVLGNWQVRADARRTWKTKTNIESLIQT